MKPALSVLSYNIHKGFATGNRSLITRGMREAVHVKNPDLLFLQEVVGRNDLFKVRFQEWPEHAQHDYFKSDDLTHGCYGQNVSYPEGHHGNAILGKEPFYLQKNIDVSVFNVEKRGVLHSAFIPTTAPHLTVHCLCIHLGLIEYERKIQCASICEYVRKEIPDSAPLLIVGDFNDWRQRISPYFKKEIGVSEAFLERHGRHAQTFPSWLPIARLDRIYFRNLRLLGAERLFGKPWSRLSDHIPLFAQFDFC